MKIPLCLDSISKNIFLKQMHQAINSNDDISQSVGNILAGL
jgi:hypothetical protein